MIKHNIIQFNYRGFSTEKLEYMYSFDFDINFIVGGRSNYKTSTIQCKTVKNYFEHGEKAIRLVRFDRDKEKEYVEQFFSPFARKYCKENYGYEIIYDKRKYWFCKYDENDKVTDKREFMRIVALNKAHKLKSNGLEEYSIIFYDEFAPEDHIYLKNEMGKLLSLISTVNRNRTDNHLKVFLVGNMIDVNNYYFDYFGIDAFELRVNNIYDYSVEGFQRVGVFVVDPVFEDFTDAPRILRSINHNIQETSQEEYQLPDDIINVNDVFMHLLVNDHDAFYNRFIVKNIIDVTFLNEHHGYIYIYIDIYDDSKLYVMGDKVISSNIYSVFSEDYNESNCTNTIKNSVVEKPVYKIEHKKYLYADSDIYKFFNKLIMANYI